MLDSFDDVTTHPNTANFVRDGAVFTDPAAYCQGLYTGIGNILHNIVKHSPPWLEARIDIGKLRECISVKDDNGKRIQPSEWSLRPDEHLKGAHKRAVAAWMAHKAKYESVMPFVAHKTFYPSSASTGMSNDYLSKYIIYTATAATASRDGEVRCNSRSPSRGPSSSEQSEGHSMELRGRKRVQSPDEQEHNKSTKKQKRAKSDATRRKSLHRSGML